MTDLDERILKVNIPNKYSQWKDTNHNNGNDDELDSCCCNNPSDTTTTATTTTATTTTRRRLPTTTSNQTGVKGVLHDYHNAKQSNTYQQTLQRNETQQHIQRLTTASTMEPGDTSISLASLKLHDQQQRRRRMERTTDSSSSSDESSDGSDDDCDDDDDEAFLQSYRLKRMEQMQENALQAQQQQQQQHSNSIFGTYQTINLEQFTTIIEENINTRIYCIFHLYQDGIPSCALMDQHLSQLSKSMESSCCCCIHRMDITEFKPNFDPVGFPSVLVYQAGVEIANLTPLTQHIPSWDHPTKGGGGDDGRLFTLDDVRYVLGLYGCGGGGC